MHAYPSEFWVVSNGAHGQAADDGRYRRTEAQPPGLLLFVLYMYLCVCVVYCVCNE